MREQTNQAAIRTSCDSCSRKVQQKANELETNKCDRKPQQLVLVPKPIFESHEVPVTISEQSDNHWSDIQSFSLFPTIPMRMRDWVEVHCALKPCLNEHGHKRAR